MAPGSKISVIFYRGKERYGTLDNSSDLTFSFHDIDEKTDQTVSYEEVAKVKRGYSGYNSITGRHTDHTRALIVGGIVIGGLIVLVIAGARS
jgi:hypothetical protein